MRSPEIRCVGGIDVAHQAPVVCALAAPSGPIRHQPSRSEATAAGDALLLAWRETWSARALILMGWAATGPLWEPLSDTLTPHGDAVVRLNPRQTSPPRGRPAGGGGRRRLVWTRPPWPGAGSRAGPGPARSRARRSKRGAPAPSPVPVPGAT